MRNPNGAGSFATKPNGKIKYRKMVGRKEDGRPKILVVTGSSKSECLKLMKTKEKQWIARKQQTNSKFITVFELCMMHLSDDMSSLKPKSIDRRECTINNQISPYIGRLQADSVTENEISKFFDKLLYETDLSSSSIKKVLDVIAGAYNWGKKRNIVNINPIELIKGDLSRKISARSIRNAEDADVIVLSKQDYLEFEKLCLLKDNEEYVYAGGRYLLFLLYTGLRVGELLAMRWSEVDWNHRTIVIKSGAGMIKNREESDDKHYVRYEGSTKNHKARILELSDSALATLDLIRQETKRFGSEFVTITNTGNLNTASNLEARVHKIYTDMGREAEYGYSLHVLRRTFATNLFDKGIPIKSIAAYIGDLETTVSEYYIAAREARYINGQKISVVPCPKQ